jgi:hypothetical protein
VLIDLLKIVDIIRRNPDARLIIATSDVDPFQLTVVDQTSRMFWRDVKSGRGFFQRQQRVLRRNYVHTDSSVRWGQWQLSTGGGRDSRACRGKSTQGLSRPSEGR